MTNAEPNGDTSKAAATISQASTEGQPRMDKIVVAIHGIGNQLRSDTIRSVARRFGDRSCPPLPVMPLGYFNIGPTTTVRVSRLEAERGDPLARIGFAEVFWADIPEQVAKANDTLEETKAWGRTIVSRAETEYRRHVPNGSLTPEDFQLGVGVIEEIVEAIGVLENLLTVFAKMGLFKFELAPLLRDYVGDVQLVTDFPFYRRKILYRFHNAMAQILATFEELYPGHSPEIYIVAHSEGTVISFIGMLEALSARSVVDPDDTSNSPVTVNDSWIRYVRGYMTIGSPIDKHIVLWPALWTDLDIRSELEGETVVFAKGGEDRLELSQRIKWRNYYDYGDPIGFQLDTAVELLADHGCEAFDFQSKDDLGFSRYWLPGKAHTDYWQDAEVFGHFIEDVVLPTGAARAPQSSWFVDRVSMLLPYLLTLLLHVGAVYLLYKAVTQVPAAEKASQVFDRLPLQVGLLGLLLMSVTVSARLPRLVKSSGARWKVAALLSFMIGAGLCVGFLPAQAAEYLSAPFSAIGSLLGASADGRWTFFLVALAIATSGWALPRRPNLGRRWMIGFGTAIVAFIVFFQLNASKSTAPVWPVVLAGAAFLYLWWLGILMFDLTFIWHRYIRRSVAVRTLQQWRHGRDAVPDTLFGRRGRKSTVVSAKVT